MRGLERQIVNAENCSQLRCWDADERRRTQQSFSLDGLASPALTFRHDYVLARLGGSQDVARVEISTDGGATWAVLTSYTGGGIYGAGARLFFPCITHCIAKPIPVGGELGFTIATSDQATHSNR